MCESFHADLMCRFGFQFDSFVVLFISFGFAPKKNPTFSTTVLVSTIFLTPHRAAYTIPKAHDIFLLLVFFFFGYFCISKATAWARAFCI